MLKGFTRRQATVAYLTHGKNTQKASNQLWYNHFFSSLFLDHAKAIMRGTEPAAAELVRIFDDFKLLLDFI